MHVATLLYLVSFINLALGGLVFWRNPTAEINRVFSLTAVLVAAWTITNALFLSTNSVAVAAVAANVSYASSLLVTTSLFHFSQIFPEHANLLRPGANPQRMRIIWVVAALFCITPLLPHFLINTVELEPQRRIITNPGIYLIALFLFATVLGAIRSLIATLLRTAGRQRMQVRYVLTGMAVTAIAGIFFNLVLPLANDYSLVWLGPSSSLIFVSCTVYSIVRERLFDIRIVIKRTLVYSILLAGIAGAFSLLEYLLSEALKETTFGNEHRAGANVLVAMVVGLFVSPSKASLEKWANRVVFGRNHRRNNIKSV